MKSELKRWHAKTWRVMSALVRRRTADWQGYVSCYTCPARLPWKEMQAGHWKHGRLDFDERNLKPQCPRCNLYLSGHLDVYTLKLVQAYGAEWVQQLALDATNHPGYPLGELKLIHAQLIQELSALCPN